MLHEKDRRFCEFKVFGLFIYQRYADMAELADAPDLGSGGNPVQVQVLLSALMQEIRAFKGF